jgi:hypothetical protein
MDKPRFQPGRSDVFERLNHAFMADPPLTRQGVRQLDHPRNGRERHVHKFIPTASHFIDMGEWVPCTILLCACGAKADQP